MKTTRKALVSRLGGTLALGAVLALAGCGSNDPGAAEQENTPDGKSPLAEYMGEGFSSGSGGMTRSVRIGGNENSEEELAKQRKVEDATAKCMTAAGFKYVPVPPESDGKSKFNEAFNLPPDKFAEQYGYGISTIDWSKAGEDSSDPNKKIRDALSATAKKAYDKALNGDVGGNGVIAVPAPGKGGPTNSSQLNLGCRGKAAEEVYGKREEKVDDFSKFESLFKDLEALRKRIETDQRVADATTAWADCLADAGQSGYKKPEEPRSKVQQKLDELTGNGKGQPGQPGKPGIAGPPSFDKVDAQKLADLRKFERDLAVADQKCKAKGYDEAYKKVQFEMEKEFVAAHKAQLEQYRDGMAQR